MEKNQAGDIRNEVVSKIFRGNRLVWGDEKLGVEVS